MHFSDRKKRLRHRIERKELCRLRTLMIEKLKDLGETYVELLI